VASLASFGAASELAMSSEALPRYACNGLKDGITAEDLARLAVESARKKTVKAGKDGTSYLLNARC
jgi:hypothetical protein